MSMITRKSSGGSPSRRAHTAHSALRLAIACACLLSLVACREQNDGSPAGPQAGFDTPEAAAEALIVAAENYDVAAFTNLLGPEGMDLVVSEDPVQDKQQSAAFAAMAREKLAVDRDPEDAKVAIVSVGPDDFPLAIPIVEQGGKWRFDAEAGRQESLNRRIGRNELLAIELCRGYVEAQHAYAMEKHDGARVNQYAQRVISTPGKQDGLAWQTPDGTWEGPVGEGVARAIAQGYSTDQEPYNGYLFKVLTGQGPSAPMGEMDFLVGGAMIGGFALVAAPAEYEATGIKTFIVSHEGIVYEKDLGPETLEAYRVMERYDPDPSWTAVEEQ